MRNSFWRRRSKGVSPLSASWRHHGDGENNSNGVITLDDALELIHSKNQQKARLAARPKLPRTQKQIFAAAKMIAAQKGKVKMPTFGFLTKEIAD